MKKIRALAALVFCSSLAFTATAQLRTTTRGTVQQGQFIDYPGSFSPTATNTTPPQSISDTLQVSDTVAYIIPITHLNDVDLYHQFYWNKIGSGTATLTLLFFQSNDPYNFTAVHKGAALSAYTKSYTLSASGWNYVSFAEDTAFFKGRYLKVEYMTSSTASVGGKVFSRTKTTIK